MSKVRMRLSKRGTAAAAAAIAIAVVLGVTGAFAAPKPAVTPTPTLNGPAAGAYVSTRVVTFSWTAAPSTTYTCAFDTGAPVVCTTSATSPQLADGSHTFTLTAKQAGKTDGVVTRAFTVDTVAPVVTIAKAPEADDPQTAQFKVTTSESSVELACSLDAGPWKTCGTSVNYNKLAAGDHCFAARATDPASNVGSAQKCWTVVVKQQFAIDGDVAAPLYPGTDEPLDLLLSNPNSFSIRVLKVGVGIAADEPSCEVDDMVLVLDGAEIAPAGGVRTIEPDGLVLSGNRSARLSELGHQLELRYKNTPRNQDACKDVSLSLTYSGTATR